MQLPSLGNMGLNKRGEVLGAAAPLAGPAAPLPGPHAPRGEASPLHGPLRPNSGLPLIFPFINY